MNKYSTAINSIVFLLSLFIGIYVMYILLYPGTTTLTPPDESLRIVNKGVVSEVHAESFIFSYNYIRPEETSIEITKETKFYSSTLLVDEDGVVYGREVVEVPRSQLSIGDTVVVDWFFEEGRGYVAKDVTFVDPNVSTLLY